MALRTGQVCGATDGNSFQSWYNSVLFEQNQSEILTTSKKSTTKYKSFQWFDIGTTAGLALRTGQNGEPKPYL